MDNDPARPATRGVQHRLERVLDGYIELDAGLDVLADPTDEGDEKCGDDSALDVYGLAGRRERTRPSACSDGPVTV